MLFTFKNKRKEFDRVCILSIQNQIFSLVKQWKIIDIQSMWVDVCYQDVLTRFPQNEMIKNFEAGGFELSKFPLSRYAHGTCDVDFQRWQWILGHSLKIIFKL